MTSMRQPDQQGDEQTVSSGKTKVTVSLTRTAEGGTDGIAIDGWSAVSATAK